MEKPNNTFLPTEAVGLPYAGAPLGVYDLIQRQVDYEARLSLRAAAKASVVPPSKRFEIPKMKYSHITRNWSIANIYRKTWSIMLP